MDEVIEPGEKQVMVIHRHWIGLAPAVIAIVLTALIGGAGAYLLGRYGSGARGFYGGVGLLAILLLGVVLSYSSIVIYRQNRLVISTGHIYLVSQLSLLNRKVSQCRIGELQDVAADKSGALQTVLDYGSLTVETAGEQENFIFTVAPRPEGLADRILEVKHQIENGTLPVNVN